MHKHGRRPLDALASVGPRGLTITRTHADTKMHVCVLTHMRTQPVMQSVELTLPTTLAPSNLASVLSLTKRDMCDGRCLSTFSSSQGED